MLLHLRLEADPAYRWLRERVRETCADQLTASSSSVRRPISRLNLTQVCITDSIKNTQIVTHDGPILREAQAEATRERILAGVEALIIAEPEADFSFEALAAASGVNRRTIFRHFPDKAALLAAFWTRANKRLGACHWPETEADLTALPPVLFAALDKIEPIVRAAHASGPARDMRLQANAERQAAFRTALAEIAAGLPAERARALEAAVQLLFSATAWLTIKDYWNLSGQQAGEAAARAIDALLEAARRKQAHSNAHPPTEEPQ